MAYLPSYQDEDEQQQQPSWRASAPSAGGFAAPASPMATGQVAPAWSPGGGWAPSAPQTDAGQGKFVNFSRYLSGNRGAAGATGEGLASSVGGKAGKVQADLAAKQGAFGQAVSKGSPFGAGQQQQRATPPAPGTAPSMSTAGGVPGNVSQAPRVAGIEQQPTPAPGTASTGVAQQGLEGEASGKAFDPSAVQGGAAAAPISLEEAQRRSGQTYTGPGSLGESGDWKDFLAQGAEAQSGLNAIGSEAKRGALLQDQYGYGRGQGAFDSAMTGAISGDRFRELQSKYGDLSKQLEQADVSSKAQADAARGQTAQMAGQYKSEADAEAAARDAAAQTKSDQAQEADRNNVGSDTWMKRFQSFMDARHKKQFGHEVGDLFSGGYNSKNNLSEQWGYLQKIKQTNPQLYESTLARIQQEMEDEGF